MKTRKEQITQIKGMISQAVADGEVTPKCATDIMDAYDAILAMPLDVPSDEEIMQKYPFIDEDIDLISNLDNQEGAKWMKEEIIKRNQK